MSPDYNSKTGVTHTGASVMPFAILAVIVLLLAVGAYSWPEMQQVLSSPTPSGNAPPTPAPSQP